MQKGAFDKALAEYHKLLRADPKDTNVRLKIGDLLLKKGDARGATDAYTQVAEIFTSEGFDAKAVAIYKQILKGEPASVEARVRLGDLYQRLGLPSDALREFQAAAKVFQERGQKREAFDLLKRVSSLDPSNVPNRLTLAQLFIREGMKDEAREEFASLLGEVERAGSAEAIERVATQMLSTFPDDGAGIRALGQAKLTAGNPKEAIEILRRALGKYPDDVPLRETLVAAYEAKGDTDNAQSLWREIAELCKRRGDVDRARDILQRHAPAGSFLEPSTPAGLELDTAASAGRPASSPELTPETDDGVTPPPSGRSADDLVRDARKHAQAGRIDDADRAARQALQVDATCDGARALLADLAVKRDDPREALRLHKERRGLAQAGGDGERMAEIDVRIRELEPKVAKLPPAKAAAGAAKPQPAAARPAPAAAKPPPRPLQASPVKLGEPKSAAARAAGKPGDELPDIELVLEDEEGLTTGKTAEAVPPPRPPPPPAAPSRPAPSRPAAWKPPPPAPVEPAAEFEVTFDDEAADDGVEIEVEMNAPPAPVAPPPPPAAPRGASAIRGKPVAKPPSVDSGSTVVGEQLNEAQFFYDQEMFEEAEAIYQKILARVPQHPQALLRMGEIEARRGSEPDVEIAPPQTPLGDTAVEPNDDIPSLDGFEEETIPPKPPPPPPKPRAAPPPPPPPKPAPPVVAKPAPVVPKPAPSVAKPIAAPKPAARAPEPIALSDPGNIDLGAELAAEDPALVGAPEPEEEGGDFDLAAELSAHLEDTAPSKPGTTAEAFDDVFRAFKKGIEAHLGPEEADAHYDLAIAYKEMGLLEDAVRELELVVRGGRKLEGLTLMAACKVELERPEEAVHHAREALALPDLARDVVTSLHYELGVALAAAGEREAALEELRVVVAADREFRDAADRIKELSRSK